MNGSPERIQLCVSGDVLNSRDPRFPRVAAVTAAVENVLRRVYAQEHDGPTPFIRNRVDAWTMQFRPDPDSMFGDYLLTVEVELGERRMPVTVDQMQAEVARLLRLSTPRKEPAG